MKNVIVIINTDNGWDNVICIADSMEAAAYYMEYDSVEELEAWVDNRGGEIIIKRSVQVETLPEGCSTAKEAWEKQE